MNANKISIPAALSAILFLSACNATDSNDATANVQNAVETNVVETNAAAVAAEMHNRMMNEQDGGHEEDDGMMDGHHGKDGMSGNMQGMGGDNMQAPGNGMKSQPMPMEKEEHM